MQIGRRRSMFICLVIGIIGNFCTISIHNFIMIVFGRFLFGFSVGLYSSIVPRMIEETIPLHLLSTMISGFCCAQHFASFISFLMGAILPSDKDTTALIETDRWLVFYIYVPVMVQIIFLLSLLFVIRYEPIKFLIRQGRTEEALQAVKQMYKYANDDQMALVYIEKIKSISGKKSSGLTLSDALFNP